MKSLLYCKDNIISKLPYEITREIIKYISVEIIDSSLMNILYFKKM